MENMASMLNEMAGGLQQSFGAVFERVGESLTQSAQMMHMMNEMMEAALLQNLSVTYELGVNAGEVGSARFRVRVTIGNDSQIRLQEVKLAVRFGIVATGEAVVEERFVEGGLDARAATVIDVPLHAQVIGHDGSIELAVRSPGTQQWLVKLVQLRLPFFKVGTIEAVAGASSMSVSVVTEPVAAQGLRDTFGVGPFDPLVTSSAGHYRLSIPGGVFDHEPVVFSLEVGEPAQGGSGVPVRISAVAVDEDLPTRLLAHCQVLKEEIERL